MTGKIAIVESPLGLAGLSHCFCCGEIGGRNWRWRSLVKMAGADGRVTDAVTRPLTIKRFNAGIASV